MVRIDAKSYIIISDMNRPGFRNHAILLEPERFFAVRHERKDLGPRHGRRWLTAIAIGALALSPVVVGADQSPALAATDWSQVGGLGLGDIDGEAASDSSGYSVSLSDDGTRVAIGAINNDGSFSNAGHVRVYSLSGTTWNQLGADIDGEAVSDSSGYSVSLSDDGTRVAIGAPRNDVNGARSNAGHVRVYSWSGTTWNQLGADIDGEAASDQSGYSVSLSDDGTRVAIGAPNNDGSFSNAGHVRVYSWNGTTWSQLGADIDGEAAFDSSGYSVSLSDDGTRVAIGAPNNDGSFSTAGHVRVYSWNGTTWSQLGADIDGEAASDSSGYSVSLSDDGTTVAIGAIDNDGGGTDAGHVRVYSWNGTTWSQLGADIDGEAASDSSGYSVSLSDDGTRVAIGAPYNGGGSNAGHVRVYSWNGTTWSQLGADIDGEAASDFSGWSVSLSDDGTRVAIGALFNDGGGSDAGHVRVYRTSVTISSEATSAGTPGIFLHITGPVGRSVAGSPVYYGADRVQVTSTYTLTLTPVGGNRPPVTMLAEGTIELNGSFSTSVRLDPLAPGSYDVQFTGTHRNGATLELTSRIVVGPGGEYMLIGDNIPIIR
jgi:hypothetical protein